MPKYYIFHAGEYIRHSHGQGPDARYPMKIKDHWSGYPRGWGPGAYIDAIVLYPGNNKYYIFRADEYVRHSPGRGPDAEYPKKIKDHWSGYPNSWEPNVKIDAIVYNPEKNKYYIFHGDEYVRHSHGQGPDARYPMKIKDHWSGWISAWENDWDFYNPISAAFYYPR